MIANSHPSGTPGSHDSGTIRAVSCGNSIQSPSPARAAAVSGPRRIRFELAINMTNAKALGPTIHDSFSMLADEVIE